VKVSYLDRAAPLFASQDEATLKACERCAQPTTGRFCAFCRAQAQILGEPLGERLGEREVAMETSDEVLPAEIYAAGRPS
jgi:hypothetical protein